MTLQEALNLALSHHAANRFPEAEYVYRQILAAHPNHAIALNNLGLLLNTQGRRDDAIAAFQAAARAAPHLPDPHYNLANALVDNGQLDEAIASYQAVIRLNPSRFEAHADLGTALRLRGRLEDALPAHRTATQLNPNSAEAWTNLGITQNEIGQSDDAVESYRTALRLKPSLPQARYNLGNALKAQGLLDEAIDCYRQAIALNPRDPVPHSNLIFTLYFHPDYDQQTIHEEELRWNDIHARPLKRSIKPHRNDRDPNRPLRIAYLAPDFRDHCQSFFTLPLLANHDRQDFQAICYSSVANPDAVTERIKSVAAEWRNVVAMSDEALAQLMRQDGIDVAVDLTMHMSKSRLLAFARKPAPVQVTWLAYPGSTGVDAINYRITDPHLDPPDANDRFYSEQSIRLPETFWCYDPIVYEPPVNESPAGQTGRVTFGCLNNFLKINLHVIRSWAGVLQAIPDSQMLVLCDPGSSRQRVLDLLQSHGVDPSRIEFVPRRPRPQYLETHHRIDIILDTFPYNGHTTTLDALWMGVPVVSQNGQRAVSRGGLSLLTNLGLADKLVAQTEKDYVRIATELANDLPRLAELRSTLRPRLRASPLMDAPRFARNMEQAFRQMWRKWCDSFR